jgi:hypothetical protein
LFDAGCGGGGVAAFGLMVDFLDDVVLAVKVGLGDKVLTGTGLEGMIIILLSEDEFICAETECE